MSCSGSMTCWEDLPSLSVLVTVGQEIEKNYQFLQGSTHISHEDVPEKK